MRGAIERSRAVKVAVSPIVGGTALKGPAADMLRSLGHEVSPVGVASLYKRLVDGMVIDNADEELAPRIREMGMDVEITDTIMTSDESRQALAERVLAFCEHVQVNRRSAGS
jgi:LPPG:FO 2-phospho-L-lactate transferase